MGGTQHIVDVFDKIFILVLDLSSMQRHSQQRFSNLVTRTGTPSQMRKSIGKDLQLQNACRFLRSRGR